NKTQGQIWEMIQEMNRKWTVENNTDALKNYFHKDMVAITPADFRRIEGGENCVAGWKNFTNNTKIHFWKETEPKVQVYGEGKFAVVTYYFDMSFDMGEQTINMKGRDMFSLVNENEKWLVVADQYSQFPNL
ncbi:MAG: nuclear transport factor 2 family protein, partial [Anaerolineaceae bacterium]|nr:nuclear transport factor 2 family protein [Anaerolineaceae bacterium]